MMLETIQLTVTGMTCGGCENAVSKALGSIDGVEEVSASHAANLVGVTFDANKVTRAMLKEKIETLGYDVAPSPPE
jgi:copper chaperone